MSNYVDGKARTSSGTVIDRRASLEAVIIETGASGGSVQFINGGASGDLKFTVNTPASSRLEFVNLPKDGVYFDTDIYVNLTNVASITCFYKER